MSGVCCRRAFTVGGEARLAGVASRGDWLIEASAHGALPLSVPLPLAQRVAREWTQDAQMEHASIASFMRFGLELLAHGAPASLVEEAQRAALDEVEHARLCFSLASRFAGRNVGPSRLRVDDAQTARDLCEAAARAFVEGCVGETIAAAQAHCALQYARDSEARRALAKIAEDEARHAELAWRFVAWASTQDPAGVSAALRHAVARTTASQVAFGPERESPETLAALHAAGRLSEVERAESAAAALADVVLPCVEALLTRSTLHVKRLDQVAMPT